MEVGVPQQVACDVAAQVEAPDVLNCRENAGDRGCGSLRQLESMRSEPRPGQKRHHRVVCLDAGVDVSPVRGVVNLRHTPLLITG